MPTVKQKTCQDFSASVLAQMTTIFYKRHRLRGRHKSTATACFAVDFWGKNAVERRIPGKYCKNETQYA